MKNSIEMPSEPGLFEFFICLSAIPHSYSESLPSHDIFSILVNLFISLLKKLIEESLEAFFEYMMRKIPFVLFVCLIDLK